MFTATFKCYCCSEERTINDNKFDLDTYEETVIFECDFVRICEGCDEGVCLKCIEDVEFDGDLCKDCCTEVHCDKYNDRFMVKSPPTDSICYEDMKIYEKDDKWFYPSTVCRKCKQ